MPVITTGESATRKLQIKMEQVARFRVAMIPNYRIAAMVGMRETSLCVMMARADYQQIENAVRAEVVDHMDATMRNDRTRALHRDFDSVIPEVFKTAVEVLRQTKDLKSRMAAATFLADRDPGRRMVKPLNDSNGPINGIATRVFDVKEDERQFLNGMSKSLAAAPTTSSVTEVGKAGPKAESPGDMAGFVPLTSEATQ